MTAWLVGVGFGVAALLCIGFGYRKNRDETDDFRPTRWDVLGLVLFIAMGVCFAAGASEQPVSQPSVEMKP